MIATQNLTTAETLPGVELNPEIVTSSLTTLGTLNYLDVANGITSPSSSVSLFGATQHFTFSGSSTVGNHSFNLLQNALVGAATKTISMGGNGASGSSSVLNFGTNNTNSSTVTINLGTGSASTGASNINIGSTVGTTAVNNTLKYKSVTGVLSASGGNVSALSSGLEGLTASEVNQLKNINASLISSTAWGYVASMTQSVAAGASVNFGTVSVNNFTGFPALKLNSFVGEVAMELNSSNSAGCKITFDTTSNFAAKLGGFALNTSGKSNALSVLANGDVGVGTASPGAKLDVSGHTRSDSLSIRSGGTYESGCIYSDINWGMLFRAAQASPYLAEFAFLRNDGIHLMYIRTLGDAEMTLAGRGLVVKTPDGTKKYRISVDNAGAIISTLV